MRLFDSTFRFFWRFRNWWKRALFLVFCLATLAALLLLEENLRGKWAWEKYQREQEKQGNRLDLQAIVPPPVPDNENFAMTPLLLPLFKEDGQKYAHELSRKLDLSNLGYKNKFDCKIIGQRALAQHVNLESWKDSLGAPDFLLSLQKFDPELGEITEASHRPYSRFPLAYEKGFETPCPHLTIYFPLVKLYVLRAYAELQKEQPEKALADALNLFRLSNTLKDEPLFISQLFRRIVWEFGLQIVWEGLAESQWTDQQLQALQHQLAGNEFLGGLHSALRSSLATINDIFQRMSSSPDLRPRLFELWRDQGLVPPGRLKWILRLIPPGCIYQNRLTANHYYATQLFPSFSPDERRVFPGIVKEAAQELGRVRDEAIVRLPFGLSFVNPYKILAAMALERFEIEKFAYSQVSTDQALIACALERYRLANARYPESLEQLVPMFLKSLPKDVTTGELFHYRLKEDGKFILYSVGWDQKDDQGEVASSKFDLNNGDWTWMYP